MLERKKKRREREWENESNYRCLVVYGQDNLEATLKTQLKHYRHGIVLARCSEYGNFAAAATISKWFCFALLCFALFCFVLFCFVLFCFVLFCFVLFWFIFICFILFYLLFNWYSKDIRRAQRWCKCIGLQTTSDHFSLPLSTLRPLPPHRHHSSFSSLYLHLWKRLRHHIIARFHQIQHNSKTPQRDEHEGRGAARFTVGDDLHL